MSGWGTQSDSAGWGPAPAANDAWGGGAAAATSGDSWGGAASNDHTMSGGANNWDGPAKDSAEKQTADFATGFTEPTAFTDGPDGTVEPRGEADDKCFNCGEQGHRVAECPQPRDTACRYCKQEGHMVRDCPDKPAMVCNNCGLEGHTRNNCENARNVNRDHVADLSPDEAWDKIKKAVLERDVDDAKEAVQEYVKATGGAITYRELQEGLFNEGVDLFLIATERTLVTVFTNMDLQGNMGKKFSISYRFTDKPDRPREAESFPKSREELLARLDDAGEVVNSGRSKCHNCGELGHVAKFCTEERTDKPEQPKISCTNCNEEGHRLRDCPQPRVDKFACKNCGKPGHKAADCEEPANLDNVECRKCHEMGHFSKDCPQAGPRGCRNCGSEEHMARDCDQPRNMDLVTCRNCEQQGHMSRDCPEPKDWSKVQCSNCQEYGHTKVRCKKAPADADGFENQGFDTAAGTNEHPGNDSWGGGDAGQGGQQSYDSGGW
ncbi:zinc finger domain-containing protein [Purpureocillium lilacinum]|uniref:Zinc finger domain-containing protein n=1 Tax=Purpureocillium lilacinum TaxID=33203 RepID=A0A2U3ELB2_PURLI|nr:zinc finger domain-containing protein [Purpureocillium lilacinum]